jgi:outer membrane lipoprotein-sorting protein
MNTDNGWQPLIERLGRVLSDRPRLAARVLQQIEEPCEPDRDHSRTRDTLLRSRSMLRWVAAGLSSIAAGLLLAFWIFGASESMAFAQVQAALREIKTAIIESRYPDNPNVNHRVLVSSAHDLFRMETKNGVVVIQSREGKTLTLNTKLRIAQMTPGAGFGLEGEEPSPRGLLLSLQEVQKNAVKSLGKKSFDGRELVGFEVPAGYHTRRYIWVDPESHLPVREEVTPLEPTKPVSEKIIQTERPLRSVVTYQFNVELSDALFSLDPPEGYKLVDSADFQVPGMELPNRPVDFNASNYVITPGQGIGAVRFGMTTQQVIAVLGKPDSFEQFGGFTAEQQKAMDELERKAKDEKWDSYRFTREANRIVRSVKSFERAGEALFYRSLGFWVSVRDDTGVQGFTCSYQTGVFQMFDGKTDRGISMNSTLADVKRVYGEPTETFEPKGSVIVTFKDLGLDFTFGDDGKMKEIGVHRTKSLSEK